MRDKLPVLKAKEVVRALLRGGFYIHHQTGSHVQLKHRDNPRLRLTVPFHSRDIPKAVIRSIIAQAGLSVAEFRDLLYQAACLVIKLDGMVDRLVGDGLSCPCLQRLFEILYLSPQVAHDATSA